MQRRARATKQAVVKRVSDERVLEEHVVVRALGAMNEVERLHSYKGCFGVFTCAANCRNQFWIKAASNCRRRLQQSWIGRGEAIDARSEQRLHAFRQSGGHRGRIEVQSSRAVTHDATLFEKACNFFGEERVAFRLRGNQFCQRLRQLLDADPCLCDPRRFSRAESGPIGKCVTCACPIQDGLYPGRLVSNIRSWSGSSMPTIFISRSSEARAPSGS